MIRCARTCAKLSVLGAIAPLAARAACNSHAQCCQLHSPVPFSAASIRFSNPLFSQSQPRSDVAAAAENAGKEGQAHATADAASSDVLAVYVTVPDLEQGKAIAHHLVKEKLAACCNIIPGITSVYEWQGAIEEDSELLLMIKTTRKRLDALTAAVQKIHTYDECEVVAVPVAGGSSTYLQWVKDTVKEDAPKKSCCK